MDWSKWNPFKFKRGKKEETSVPVASSGAAMQPAGTQSWPMIEPSRMIQEFWRDPFSAFGQMDRWFGDFSATRFNPSVNVVDDGQALRVSAELPGLEKDDVSLVIEDGSLTLRGEKKYDESHEKDGCYRIERAHGMFARTIPLPTGLDTSKAEAEFKNGVLEVTVPKLEGAVSGRKLAIK